MIALRFQSKCLDDDREKKERERERERKEEETIPWKLFILNSLIGNTIRHSCANLVQKRGYLSHLAIALVFARVSWLLTLIGRELLDRVFGYARGFEATLPDTFSASRFAVRIEFARGMLINSKLGENLRVGGVLRGSAALRGASAMRKTRPLPPRCGAPRTWANWQDPGKKKPGIPREWAELA